MNTSSIPQKVNLNEKLAQFNELWSPKIVGALNGQHVKLAKIKGEFLWHHHDTEDELFLVIAGEITIRFREGDVHLQPGELLVIPAGIEHMPVAREEASIMLFEPQSTRNTGNIVNERTKDGLDKI